MAYPQEVQPTPVPAGVEMDEVDLPSSEIAIQAESRNLPPKPAATLFSVRKGAVNVPGPASWVNWRVEDHPMFSQETKVQTQLPPHTKNNIKYIKPGSVWRNELGSILKIKYVSTNLTSYTGDFTGTYHSTVGKEEKVYKLVGQFDADGSSLGWIVSWHNQYMEAFSTTAWSGQVLLLKQTPTIKSTWLLTRQTTAEDAWKSTNVGNDTFVMTSGMDNAKE